MMWSDFFFPMHAYIVSTGAVGMWNFLKWIRGL